MGRKWVDMIYAPIIELQELSYVPRCWKPARREYIGLDPNQNSRATGASFAGSMAGEVAAERGYEAGARFAYLLTEGLSSLPYSDAVVGVWVDLYLV